MADVDDADAALAQQADDVEQPPGVMLAQRRGRLVHDEDPGVLRECLGDLHTLTVADRERADDLADVEIMDIEGRQELLSLAAHRAPIDGAEPRSRRVAEEDVLRDRQLGEKQQLLIDRRDAGALRLERARERNLTAT